MVGKRMEMRTGAFPARCRVALVDQWVDSGGSMKAAIELVERQQGVVRTCPSCCVHSTPMCSKGHTNCCVGRGCSRLVLRGRQRVEAQIKHSMVTREVQSLYFGAAGQQRASTM